MATEERKEQMREWIKQKRASQKAEGRVSFSYLIKPEWRKSITEYIKQMENTEKLTNS